MTSQDQLRSWLHARKLYLGLSYRDLARLSGVRYQVLHAMLVGRRTITLKTLEKAAKAMRLRLDIRLIPLELPGEEP